MKVSGRDQLWVADITYIRLKTKFVYLAVILDVFSRRVIGWALGALCGPNFHYMRWSGQLPIGSHRLGWCTTPIRVCNTLASITCKYSMSMECCRV